MKNIGGRKMQEEKIDRNKVIEIMLGYVNKARIGTIIFVCLFIASLFPNKWSKAFAAAGVALAMISMFYIEKERNYYLDKKNAK